MPPKVDVKTLASKMENSEEIFYELIEEFEIIFSVKPELKTLETAFNQVETRYRLIKKQQETILDRLVDDSTNTDEQLCNLIAWLHQEASIRSRGKTSTVSEGRNEGRRDKGPRKTENNTTSSEETDDETCPLNCKTKHHLAACPKFQNLTVNQKWEIIKQHWRCRKCLRAHHTNNCKKPDGSTCDKCRKNHHRSLHNEKAGETNTSLNPKAAPFQSQFQGPSATGNGHIQGNAVYQKRKFKPVTGPVCPVQKV